MITSAQLILTHGTTDLQILLCDSSGRRWRAVPDKDIVRNFHTWLLEHAPDADIVDVPSDVHDRKTEASFTDWDGERFTLRLRGENLTAYPARTDEGRLQVLLPKIEPALSQWLAEETPSDNSAAPVQSSPMSQALQDAGLRASPLRGVLVLSTDRGQDEQEPIATATFLKRWLAQKGVPDIVCQEVIFLRAGERLESDDSPIAPKIAQRIEKAMRDFYDSSSSTLFKPTLLVASMGGLPQIKPLLAEMAVLLAGAKARSLFKTERGAVGLLPRTAIDALRVRRQCLEQVRSGALLDAWAMAAPFYHDPDARAWVHPLEQAARLLNGNPVGERVKLPALQRIIEHADKASCLLVAIRVETALLNERWLEAINGSLTFLEAAFHDAINLWAKDTLIKYDPKRRYMRFHKSPPSVLEKGALEPWKGRDAGPLSYQANTVGDAALRAWGVVLRRAPIERLRTTIHKSVQLAKGGNFKLADYRNFNTHGVMTQEEIDEALTRFMGTNLWSQGCNNPASRPKPGKCFLGRGLVSDVIDDLTGLDDSSAMLLYQELLQQLESCLINPDNGL